jgi:hypothetical protein
MPQVNDVQPGNVAGAGEGAGEHDEPQMQEGSV